MITISDNLADLLQKLALCQDSKTASQRFLGTVRVTVDEDRIVLDVEDSTWETADSGDQVNTKLIRAR
jgi:hypothetical protein